MKTSNLKNAYNKQINWHHLTKDATVAENHFRMIMNVVCKMFTQLLKQNT